MVTEFRGMALNGLFYADVLRPLDLAPLTDFTYKYHPAEQQKKTSALTDIFYSCVGISSSPGAFLSIFSDFLQDQSYSRTVLVFPDPWELCTTLCKSYKRTRLVVDDGSFALVARKQTAGQAVALVLGQPRVAREEVVFALGRHVHLDVPDEPAARLRHAVVTQLFNVKTHFGPYRRRFRRGNRQSLN